MRYIYLLVALVVLAVIFGFPEQVDGLFILTTLALFGSIYLVRRLGR